MLSIIVGIFVVLLVLGLIISLIKFIGKVILGVIGLGIIGGLIYAAVTYFPAKSALQYGGILLKFGIVCFGTILLGVILNALFKPLRLRPLCIIALISLCGYAMFKTNASQGWLYYVVFGGYVLANGHALSRAIKYRSYFKELPQWREEFDLSWAASLAGGFLLAHRLLYTELGNNIGGYLNVANQYIGELGYYSLITAAFCVLMTFADGKIVSIYKKITAFVAERKCAGRWDIVMALGKGENGKKVKELDEKLVDAVLDRMVYHEKLYFIDSNYFDPAAVAKLKQILAKLSMERDSFTIYDFTDEADEDYLEVYPEVDSLIAEIAPELNRAYDQGGTTDVYIPEAKYDRQSVCECCHSIALNPIMHNGGLFCSQRCIDVEEACENIYKARLNKNQADGVGTVYGMVENAATLESNIMINTPRGHGFAAEKANHMIDVLNGKDAKIIGGDNARDGADRLVNGQLIQSKYCKTGSKCIAECFKNGKLRYVDANGKPMRIEVPADKYDAAVKAMEERIRTKQVPGVDDIREAKNIVKKGSISYEQAKNIAKAGTVESVVFDTVNGIMVAGSAGGMTFVVSFAMAVWNGEDAGKALEEACYQGIKVGGVAFITSVATNQLVKTTLGGAIQKSTTQAVGAVTGKILPQQAAKAVTAFSRSNVLVGTVTLAVMSVGDFNRFLNGELSGGKLLKNTAKKAVGIAGGYAGMEAGAAIGAMIPLPGTAFIGGVIGGLLGGVFANSLVGGEEKSNEIVNQRIDRMYPIFQRHIARLANEYMLTKEEFETVLSDLKARGLDNLLINMYDEENKVSYITCALRPIIVAVVASREVIEMPQYETIEMTTQNIVQRLAG